MRSEKTKKTRKYRRSTPVGRLRRNAEKVARHATLMRARIASWKSDNADLAKVDTDAELVVGMAEKMGVALERLEQSGFVPPPKSTSVTYEPGDHVAVAESYLQKYREALAAQIKDDPEMLEDMVVDKVLPTGEIVLRRGRRIVIPMAPKSHLVRVELEDDEEE